MAGEQEVRKICSEIKTLKRMNHQDAKSPSFSFGLVEKEARSILRVFHWLH